MSDVKPYEDYIILRDVTNLKELVKSLAKKQNRSVSCMMREFIKDGLVKYHGTSVEHWIKDKKPRKRREKR